MYNIVWYRREPAARGKLQIRKVQWTQARDHMSTRGGEIEQPNYQSQLLLCMGVTPSDLAPNEQSPEKTIAEIGAHLEPS